MIRNRSLLALLAGEVTSSLGTQMTWLALPWFVLVTTGSPARMGLVYAAELLPLAILGIPVGTLVERVGARTAMLVCDLARAPLVALVPVLQALDALSFGILLLLVSLVGVFTTPYFTSQRLVLPEVIGEDERLVAQANSLLEGATRLTTLVGPALAGVLIGLLGATNVLWLDAGSYLVAFAFVLRAVPVRAVVRAPEEHRGLLAGIRFVLHDPLLVRGATASLVFGFLFPVLFASLPVLAFERYEANPSVQATYVIVAALATFATLVFLDATFRVGTGVPVEEAA